MTIDVRPFRTWRIALVGLSVLSISLLVVYLYQKEKRKPMDIGRESSVLHAHIPPIDKALPVKVETATFALG